MSVPDLAGQTLPDRTQAVQELVDAAAQPPVVLAHSFGGVTASGLQGASHLLYLNSFVFDVGESAQEWIERIDRETDHRVALLPLTVEGDGQTHVDPAGARAGLFADCDDATVERAVALLRPEPASTFTDAPACAGWRETPST